MREIVLDTETTGLDPALGHRLVEIGALELFNHIPTGRTYHVYINPERDMPTEAEAVHGLSASFLRSQPKFAEIAHQFSEFIADSTIIIHNAAFDLGFLNAELALLGREPILPARIVDTLQLARLKHPMGPNSLDALCKRYGIDNSKRTRHGALLDSELLAEVYIELIGGRQITLSLDSISRTPKIEIRDVLSTTARPRPLPLRLNAMERDAHAKLVEELGPKSMWKLLER